MEDDKPLICVVDDDNAHRRVLSEYLVAKGFRVVAFASGSEFLERNADVETYDLVISDINMPGISGLELCRSIRQLNQRVRLPVILITGNDPSADHAKGLDAGADDFIGKPYSIRHVLAKIRSLIEIRVHEKKRHREHASTQGLNDELRRFLSPNIASRLAGESLNSFLEPHRAEVTVLFADLRRFTAFSERVEPEEVLEVLRHYYTAVGRAAIKYKGTLGHLAGDGIMVFFNDPEPVKDHTQMAIRMALEAREELLQQKKIWEERQYDIDFGMGISEGFATIGGIGFDRFSQYSVIGTVSNFASRLCHLAVDGQILISRRYLSRLEPGFCRAESVGEASLKGIEKPVSLYNILSVA
jgi:class 3 adenylate cyclase